MTDFIAGLDGTPVRALSGFFAGWPRPPSAETLHRVLSRSTVCVVAHQGDSVVGFANALSDGLFAAYIPLLEVRAEYQGQGIGSELVRRVMALLGDVYMVDVVCDDGTAAFYERLGLSRLVGMAHRNRDAAVLDGG